MGPRRIIMVFRERSNETSTSTTLLLNFNISDKDKYSVGAVERTRPRNIVIDSMGRDVIGGPGQRIEPHKLKLHQTKFEKL